MIRKQSISQNFFFQYAYQILILVIPLVLAPYLSRALRKTGHALFIDDKREHWEFFHMQIL